MRVLRQVVDVNLVRTDQRMLERNIDRSIAILNIKHNCIAARLAPAADDLHAVVACRHQSS